MLWKKVPDQSVYTCYDQHGGILYIGRSSDVDSRIRTHRRSSPFGMAIVAVSVSPLMRWMKAVEQEQKAIRQFNPPHNLSLCSDPAKVEKLSAIMRAGQARRRAAEIADATEPIAFG